MLSDLRAVLRVNEGRKKQPTAAVIDSRTVRPTPESGHRAGYDGHKKTNGSNATMAVDTLGQLLALVVTPADENDRAAVAGLAEAAQKATGETVELAWLDQGCTGEQASADAAQHGIRLEEVKFPEAKRGFVLLPHRWVVERSFAWSTRFRRLIRDYERLPETLRGRSLRCLLVPDAHEGRSIHLEFITGSRPADTERPKRSDVG